MKQQHVPIEALDRNVRRNSLAQNHKSKGIVLALALGLAVKAVAANVAPATGYTNAFNTQPPATDWATLSMAGGGSDTYDLDTDVNANVTANGAQTVADASNPAAQNASATWSSSGFYLQTRPTGNRYTVLVGKFVNLTDTNATQISLSYLFTIASGGTAEDAGKGTRVYYSLTGQTNSWTNLATLNNTASANGSATLATNLALNWTNGASLYLAWADDNASSMGIDVANQMDNFSLRVTAGTPVSRALACTLTLPTNHTAFLSGNAVTAAVTVVGGTLPYAVEFWTNSGAGNPVFHSSGYREIPPYELNWGVLPVGAYNVYASVTDEAGDGATTNSLTNTFVVADPMSVTLTAPVPDAIFDYTTAVLATAAVSGGTAPFSVQFFLDGLADGAPVVSAPYNHNVGPLQVGDHTLNAVVTDASGWVSNSPVHTIHITGPLFATLMPEDGMTYNYGQTLTLTAAVAGGAAPYTVRFYTNDQLTGVLSAPPFTVSLGVLPVGSYTCYVQATDSSTPLAQQTNSTTNVITILANPLTALLTSPTNGQRAATNMGFTATATVAVGAPVTVSNVEFFMDEVSAGMDSTAPYSLRVANLSVGGHNLYAVATDSLGRRSYTATNQVTGIVDPLANDQFANRIVLSGPAMSVTGSNVGATTENGEPTGSFFSRFGASLWWTWTAPATGTARLDTYGSSFNTMLGVYTGSAVNALSTVAQNDNAPGMANVSLVTFNAQQGTEYQIQVSGMLPFGPGSAATGAIQLNLQMPPSVTLTAPTNGSVFLAGSNILLTATASSPNGPIQRVDFYSGGILLGGATAEPYSLAVTNAPLGTNRLAAVATDSLGLVATSAVVNVTVLNWGVTIVTPADGTYLLNTNPLTVGAMAWLPSGSMARVEFFVDEAKFGQDTNAPFSLAWSNVVPGVHQFTVVGTDSGGLVYTSAPVLVSVARPLVLTNVIWKFLDTGVDLGTAWRAPDFDDTAWPAGPAPLGYGDANGLLPATTNSYGSDPSNKFITTYYRYAFPATNTVAYSNLYLRVQRDDGVIVYLNGQEVYRQNIPNGPVTATNFALSGVGMSDEVAWYSTNVSRSLLREGANVLAAEIHQSDLQSTDIWFDLELLGQPLIIWNQAPAVAFVQPANQAFFMVPDTVTLEAEAADADGTVAKVEFFWGNTKLGESTNPPYALVLTNVPAGSYTFTATATDNQGAVKATAPITVYVFNMASRWVAFNDHYAGVGTHANATTWNIFGTEGGAPGNEGPLRNLATGDPLSAYLTILGLNAFGDTAAGRPLAGTPADNLFNGHVDFGSGNLNHAILVNANSSVIHLFTGLNPLRRYSFRGTAVGGVAAYSNRWTRFTLVGAEAYLAAHTTHVLTAADQPEALAHNEAAMNTGDNRTGDVVGWDHIVPGADGSLLIISAQYIGPAPGNARPGPLAYAPVAVRLQEFGPMPLVWVTAPSDGMSVEGPTNVTITATAAALSSNATMQFLANGAGLGEVAANPATLVWSNAPFGAHDLAAVACDTDGVCSTSAVTRLTVTIPPTNTVPPFIVSQNPPTNATITNLTSIYVTFSEPVVGVAARDFLINDVPATNLVGGGSNYLFYLAQPPYGPVRVRWAADHGITDVGWPERLAFYENEPSASWSYNLVDRTLPVIAARNPAAGATVTNLTQIAVTFSEAVTGVEAGDLLINGTRAYDLSGYGSNYTFSFSQPPSGTVNISWATGHGITDLAAAPNPFNATGAGATWGYTLDARTVLVQSNSFWYFLKGTNEASTPTNLWRMMGFDDAGWANAPAPFFYGDPYSNGVPNYTLLSDMRSNYSSIYLRQMFVLPNAAAVTSLFLRAQSDDGFIAWINGVEVWRYNVGPGEQPYNGIALTNSSEPYTGGAYWSNYTLPNPKTYLISGANLLAVQAFNESLATSSDFGFNAQLYTYQTDTEVVAPRLVRKDPAAGYVLELTNITVTFSEAVTNVNAADLLVNGVPATDLAFTNTTTYTFRFPQPPYGTVAITWATQHGIVDVDITPKPFDTALPGSIWTYTLLNPNSPHIVSKSPDAGSTVNQCTQLTLTFNEPVSGVDAADLLVNGLPASTVTGTGADYTFTFAQPAYGTVSITWVTNHGIQNLNEPPVPFDPSWPIHTWTFALVDQTPPAVAMQEPATGPVVTNLTQVTVYFTEAVSGVNAGDLLLNGRPATGMTGSNTTYTFTFPQPNASVVNVTWAANHGIRDLAATPNAFNAGAPGSTWSYTTLDNMPPQVLHVNPVPFLIVRSLARVNVAFDEPVRGVEAGDLLLHNVPAQQVSGDGAGPYTFVFNEPATGLVQVAWAAGHGIEDLAAVPNAFAGGAWTYVLNPGIAYDFAVSNLVHISLDGVGSAYLEQYMNNAPASFPNFVRLRNEGAATLNARTDYDITVTLPNHADMFTGRPAQQPAGWGNTTHHGLTIDSDNGTTIHYASTGNPNVPYKMSVFDVAHDHGLSTAFLYSKQSLTIFARSWDAAHGAADVVDADNGTGKIDVVFNSTTGASYGPTAPVVDEFLKRVVTNSLWQYTFMHFDDGDATGHASSWGSATYSNGVRVADQQIGRVLEGLQANPAYSNRTVVIVTADHGGGSPSSSHNVNSSPLNYRIPLFVWGPGIPAGVDLYTLFANRADPGGDRADYGTPGGLHPLRDGDTGNLALTLLGLPTIPGSSLIPIFGHPPVPLAVTKTDSGVTIAWLAEASDYDLQFTPVLGANAQWQTVTNGVADLLPLRVFTFQPGAERPTGFFRLQKR